MGIFANSGELQSGSMVKYESLNPFLCEDLFLIPIIHIAWSRKTGDPVLPDLSGI
jgi:hypothetical protein